TRRLAPAVVFRQGSAWYFPLAVTRAGEVLFDLPLGDFHRIEAVPLDGSQGMRSVVTLTAPPVAMDAGPDDNIYADQLDQAEKILRFSPADRRLERFPLPGREIGYFYSIPLPDGRIVTSRRISGRQRLMVWTPEGVTKPMIQTQEETAGPLTMLGSDRLAFLEGSGTNRTVAIATLDGRVLGKVPQIREDIQALAG